MANDWELARFGDVLKSVSRPVTIEPEKMYRVLGMRWYAQGLFLKEEKPGQEIRAKEVYRVELGDFVYNRLFAWKGSFGIVERDTVGGFVSGEFPCFRVDTEHADAKFLHLYLSQEHVWDDIVRISSGQTNVSRLRLKEQDFLRMEIPLPPLAEQQRIVARVDALARRVGEARGLRRAAVEEAEAVMPSYATNLPFPEGQWGTVSTAVLNRKGSVRSGPFGRQLHHEEFVESGVAAIGTRDVLVNRFALNGGWFITPEKFRQFKRYQVFPDDILATIVGASIGRFCVVPKNIPLAFTTKHILALTLNQDIAEPRFVSYMLNLHSRSRTSLFSQREGSAQPSLNASKMLNTQLPLPPLADQHRIVACLDGLQAKVDELRRLQAETQKELDALMPSILARAFAGEL